ncbi:MAG: twin-arginine translocase TatA/TatE family subunit [bacterium]|nr:twin-arginine translocase TatA/TatE family subunit [bacterium]
MKISPQELLIVLAIVVLIFGPTQIPKISKMMGKSIHNFKKGMEEDTESEEKVNDEKEEE